MGYLIAEVTVRERDPYVEKVKKTLKNKMYEMGISADTMLNHPDVRRWREVFAKMGVKPSKYKSSLEALLRRLFKGDIWSVSNVVDLYDCASALNLLPMGAHDLEKLKGGLTLRFGREGEPFSPLGAEAEVINVGSRNVVYADQEKIACWLWCHRDCREAVVSGATKKAIFLIDRAFDGEWRSLEQGLSSLSGELEKIGAKPLTKGVLNAANPAGEIAV